MHPEKARGAASLSVSYLTEAAGLHASFILVEIDVTTVKSVNLRAIPLRARVREMERARAGIPGHSRPTDTVFTPEKFFLPYFFSNFLFSPDRNT